MLQVFDITKIKKTNEEIRKEQGFYTNQKTWNKQWREKNRKVRHMAFDKWFKCENVDWYRVTNQSWQLEPVFQKESLY